MSVPPLPAAPPTQTPRSPARQTQTPPTQTPPTQTPRSPAPRYPVLRHMPGLDGIRALAVVGVLLYHSDLEWIPGGFLGVDVFFVLSGFLITSLLLSEVSRSGRLHVRSFYYRRARRLFPALVAVLAASALLAATVARDAAEQYLTDLPPALMYVLNWSYILGDQSYFAAMGRPPLLQHVWSLSIEEQFYLLWPAVLLVAWRLGGWRAVGALALGGAIASTIWMAVLAVGADMPYGQDSSRVYFGTDTHAMALLLGAALATVWIPARFRAELSAGARRIIDGVGLAALAGVLATFLLVDEYAPGLYRGGFLALAALVAVLVAAASHPGGRLGPLLGRGPMRWLGERSYGLYLWHWPIFLVTRPGIDIPWDGPVAVVARLALVGVVAELSYRYVELPFRRGAFGRWWGEVRAGATPLRSRAGMALGAATLVVAVGTSALLVSAPPVDESIVASAGDVVVADEPAEAGGPGEPGEPDQPAGEGGQSSVTQSARAAGTTGTAEPAAPTYKGAAVYGDSVILGASGTMRRYWPKLKVDAAVSRHIWVVADHIRRDLPKLRRSLVVVHTGNNGIVREKDLRAMLKSLRGVPRVVVVNQSMPRRWARPNNALYATVVGDYPNVRLADWAKESKGRRDFFNPDQVHSSAKGAKAYAKLIKAAAEAR